MEKKSELERDLDYYKRKSEWQNKIIVKMQEENRNLKEENEKLRIDRELEKGNTIFGM